LDARQGWSFSTFGTLMQLRSPGHALWSTVEGPIYISWCRRFQLRETQRSVRRLRAILRAFKLRKMSNTRSASRSQLGVYGLNEKAILDSESLEQHNRYRLYNQSCATTVADALTAGGGNSAHQLSGESSLDSCAVLAYALAINVLRRQECERLP